MGECSNRFCDYCYWDKDKEDCPTLQRWEIFYNELIEIREATTVICLPKDTLQRQ